MEELKPCPFCGGEGYIRRPEKNGVFVIMSIECKRCGASPYSIQVYSGLGEAERANSIAIMWNRRIYETINTKR